MQTLVFVSIALTLYALYVARNAHVRLNNRPRSFHFTLSKIGEEAKIKFYVLYLSGSRVFFDQETFDNINISRKISTFADLPKNKQITCATWGNSLRVQYADKDKEIAEQAEELSLDILSLSKASDSPLGKDPNAEKVRGYLEETGWEIKEALSFNDIHFVKDNFEVYIAYIS